MQLDIDGKWTHMRPIINVSHNRSKSSFFFNSYHLCTKGFRKVYPSYVEYINTFIFTLSNSNNPAISKIRTKKGKPNI
jgi:hypothetical protein